MTGPAMVRPASFDIWKAPSFTSISDLSSSLPSCMSCSFYMNKEIMLKLQEQDYTVIKHSYRIFLPKYSVAQQSNEDTLFQWRTLSPMWKSHRRE